MCNDREKKILSEFLGCDETMVVIGRHLVQLLLGAWAPIHQPNKTGPEAS